MGDDELYKIAAEQLLVRSTLIAAAERGQWLEMVICIVCKAFKEIGDREEHSDTLTSMANLASTYSNQGRWKEAEELEVGVLETTKRVLGEEHPSTLTSMANLAFTWKAQSQDAKAVNLIQECIRLRSRVLGVDHPNTLSSSAALTRWQR